MVTSKIDLRSLTDFSNLAARRALAALAFLVPLSVYLLTLAPGLTWAHYGADGGDLVTAAYTLGVPHPPGYPTYTSLAWLFTRLPVGSVAWRVNLLSATSTAAAAALIYWAVLKLAEEGNGTTAVFAALGAAWSFAFAPLIWSQALIAEVYGLAGLWTAVILLLALPPPSRHKPLILGMIWSLGLGVHLILIFLAPVVVWAVWRAGRRAWCRTLIGFCAGLLVWLYLPLRAGRGGVTWGQPTDLAGMWWLVSGTLYRDYVFALPIPALGERLVAWAQTWNGWGLAGLVMATWGVVWSANRRRGWLAASGLSFVVLNLYALGYNTADSVVYLGPAFVIGSIWLGAGLADLFRWVLGWRRAGLVLNLRRVFPRQALRNTPERHSAEWRRATPQGRWLTPLMLVIALLTPAWMLMRHKGALDLSADHDAENFGQAVTRDAPPRAILLTESDRQTFALWYYQQVKGLRPDVAVVDAGLVGFDWYWAGLRQDHPDLVRDSATAAVVSTDARPRCRVRRKARTEWLDCQNSHIN